MTSPPHKGLWKVVGNFFAKRTKIFVFRGVLGSRINCQTFWTSQRELTLDQVQDYESVFNSTRILQGFYKDFTRIFISSPGLHVDIWVQIIGLHIEEKQNKTEQKLHLSLYTYMVEYKNQQILISWSEQFKYQLYECCKFKECMFISRFE